jgi:hypothetical protein
VHIGGGRNVRYRKAIVQEALREMKIEDHTEEVERLARQKEIEKENKFLFFMDFCMAFMDALDRAKASANEDDVKARLDAEIEEELRLIRAFDRMDEADRKLQIKQREEFQAGDDETWRAINEEDSRDTVAWRDRQPYPYQSYE